MKAFLIFAVALIVLGTYSLSLRRAVSQTREKPVVKTDSPFFCNRTALTAEERHHQQELGKILHSALLGVQELNDGYEFEFVPGRANYQALVEFSPMEQACCPFFDISIRMEREGGKLWWRLTGREGVKTFIRAEFSPWFGNKSI